MFGIHGGTNRRFGLTFGVGALHALHAVHRWATGVGIQGRQVRRLRDLSGPGLRHGRFCRQVPDPVGSWIVLQTRIATSRIQPGRSHCPMQTRMPIHQPCSHMRETGPSPASDHHRDAPSAPCAPARSGRAGGAVTAARGGKAQHRPDQERRQTAPHGPGCHWPADGPAPRS